jgi:hypothetical protein
MSSTSYRGYDHKEWAAAGLKDYADFSDCVEYVNQEDDYCDSLRGEWWYADDETRTIYSGTFGNDHSPGASHMTFAEVYDEEEEYKEAVAVWEAQPEYLESEDDDMEEEDDLDDGGPPSDLGVPDARLVMGYAHEFSDLDDSPDDMDLVVYAPKFNERPITTRTIDGSLHVVFWCPDDQVFRAQTCVSLGVPS